MYSILPKILQILSSACPLCGLAARGGDLCIGCAQDLSEPLNQKACMQNCLSACHEFIFAIEYSYPGAMLIQRFKEGACLAYAGLFARLLWGRLNACSNDSGQEVRLGALVPIPSSQSALRRRGFNPAGELARELSRLSGCPMRYEWLVRTRDVSTQKTLGARARRESVQGLYRCPHVIPGLWVGLVDDVVTTGSTMDTAALALLDAGALGVIGLAAAYTPRTWQNSLP